MSDIFVSYASEDKGRVQALAHALERKGWSVWWDRRIPAGKSFDEVIHEALKNTRSVVVVWTKASVKSTWVKNESRNGLRRNILFPVMLLDEVEIPLEFEHLQAAHLMDWQSEQDHAGFDQFIDDLAGVIGPPVTQRQASPVSSAKPTPEPEKEPRPGVVRAALAGDNNLSALSLSTGTLSPAFAASTTDYTVNVASDVTSVNISVTKADPNAVISGDVSAGVGVATGERAIQLSGPGATTGVTIWVTAPGGSQKTYTLNVSRAALSVNNDLLALTVSPGTLSPSFSANRIFYTVNVDGNVPHITVTPTLQDTNASLTINGQGTGSGQVRSITLAPAGSSTEIEIIVTAPNGSYKTYLITLSRAALPQAAEVEPEPERLEPKPVSEMGGVGRPDSSRETFTSRGAAEFSGVSQESAQVGEDRPGESTGTGQSTKSFPYLPIGIVALVAIGVLVYFLQSLATYSRVSYEPPVQAPTTRTEVITPPPSAPEPIKQPSVVETQEKSTVKQEAAPGGTVATKPRPTAGAMNTITGKDGAPMVLIPAGEFWMGSPDGEGDKDEHPRHKVALSAFYLDKYEVTNQRFEQFVRDKGYRTTAEQEGKAYALTSMGKWEEVSGAHWRKPEGGETVFVSNREEHPVVSVSWEDAQAYCRWKGKRLPTEAEFEYATRAGTETKYWWGNGNPGSRQVANIGDESVKRQYSDWTIMTGYDDGYVRTAPVGSFEANPFDLHDMTGNVWEWTADWYDDQYYKNSPPKNPKGPSKGDDRVLRGGSWDDAPVDVRSAGRLWFTPTLRYDSFGLRCAQDRPN